MFIVYVFSFNISTQTYFSPYTYYIQFHTIVGLYVTRVYYSILYYTRTIQYSIDYTTLIVRLLKNYNTSTVNNTSFATIMK